MRGHFILPLIGIFLIAFCGSPSLEAVPAIPRVLEFKQPDGTSFNARKKGDEWFNWTETLDGRVIVHNKTSGFFEYAEIKTVEGKPQLTPSGIKVRDIDVNRPLETPGFDAVTPDQLDEIRTDARERFRKR